VRPVLADSELIFKFAHDIRSCLRTVLTRIELVQNSSASALPEADQLLLQEAAGAARDIGSLLTAMAAYLDNKVDDAPMSLGLLLRGTVIELQSVLSQSGAAVQMDRKKVDELTVPSGLKVVFKELLINSCKFRAPDRTLRIIVAVRDESDGLHMNVTDNGIGVESEFLQKIFAPFFRLHSRDEYPGHGLGLATCQKVVTALGGTIEAEQAPGAGLTVQMRLPNSGLVL
jgi:signal transduction histidine kinase